ncbi:MAG: phenylacetate--CoA ligase [Candidatus Accumulibacter sp.]|nr:phenylacetate--CoA ligase [Accumulibacter sp.]
MYWEREIETLPRPKLEALQLARLQQTIRLASRSTYYGTLYRRLNLTADSVTALTDIDKLPFTTKQDLRDSFPYGMLSIGKSEVIRLHSSSGTTGNPTAVFHNQHDIESWANLMARSLYSVGVRSSDVFQNICGYGLFTGGLGFQYGAERLGCLTIPAGAGNSQRQIKLIRDYGTNVVHAIPSYVHRLAEVMEQEGFDPRQSTELRTFIIGAEPHSEEQRLRIEAVFGVKAFNSFGLSEMNGPGVAFECTKQNGLHVWEDAFFVEIIDPSTLEPVADGEIGELVMTTLDRQAMPLLRFRTGDLTRILPGSCPCGRTHIRLDRITGRSDDMFIVKGCNIFPMQIEGVLMRIPDLGSNYLITLETIDGVDELIVEAEIARNVDGTDSQRLAWLTALLTRQIRDETLVTPIVKLLPPDTLPQSEGKAVRVRELRRP